MGRDLELPFEIPEGFKHIDKHECPLCSRPLEFTLIANETSGDGFGVVSRKYLFTPTTQRNPGAPDPQPKLKAVLELCRVRQVDCIGTEACSVYRGPEKGHEGIQVFHGFWTMEVLRDG